MLRLEEDRFRRRFRLRKLIEMCHCLLSFIAGLILVQYLDMKHTVFLESHLSRLTRQGKLKVFVVMEHEIVICVFYLYKKTDR